MARTRAAKATAAADEVIPLIPLLMKSPLGEELSSPLERRSEAYKHQAIHASKARKAQTIWTIPNILTFFRLLMVPVVMAVWDLQSDYSPLACALLFIGAAWTDWFDGYLARKMKLVSVFGAFLDPVADKVMVSTCLILLALSPPPPLTRTLMSLPVVLCICREVVMSAVREWAASAGSGARSAVKVNSLGKWKTAVQMTAMSLLLLLRQPMESYASLVGAAQVPLDVVGSRLVWGSFWLLWIGTLLSVWSLIVYFIAIWDHFTTF